VQHRKAQYDVTFSAVSLKIKILNVKIPQFSLSWQQGSTSFGKDQDHLLVTLYYYVNTLKLINLIKLVQQICRIAYFTSDTAVTAS